MTVGVHSKGPGRWRDEMVSILRDAVMVAGISFAVGLLVNLVRPDAIAFIADQPYELFVPCPEPGGEVTPMAADAPALLADDSFVLDARSKQEFDAWRLRQAVNISYDYLDPTPQETLRGAGGDDCSKPGPTGGGVRGRCHTGHGRAVGQGGLRTRHQTRLLRGGRST